MKFDLKTPCKHVYVVAATVKCADAVLGKRRMNMYRQSPSYPTKWIRSKHELWYGLRVDHAVSIYQVLHNFDAHHVDAWSFDETISKCQTDDIVRAVKILQNAFDLSDYDRRIKMMNKMVK